MLKITTVHNLQTINTQTAYYQKKAKLLSFGQNDEYSSTNKKQNYSTTNFLTRAYYYSLLTCKNKSKQYKSKLQEKLNKIIPTNKKTNVKEEKSILNPSKAVSTVTEQTVIPAFQPTFNMERFERIVNDKELKITPQWIETHPNDCLTILNAVSYPFVNDSTTYYDIRDFKNIILTTKGQAKVINAILKQPNLIEVANQRLANEKAAYIDSIWDEYIHVQTVFKPINKEKNLQGLKMLNKYGTVEDLRRLPDEYSIVKDDDLYREYAKFVTKVGTDFEDFLFLESGLSKRCDIGSEKTMEEIAKGIKRINVDIIKGDAFEGASWSEYKDFKKCIDKYPDNKVITENLNAVIKKMTDENPWMIEEINKLKK